MAEVERSLTSKTSVLPTERKSHVAERGSVQEKKEQKKGKQTAKKTSQDIMKSSLEDKESKLLFAINSLQSTIAKQTAKMAEHDKQLNDLTEKISSYDDYEEGEYFEEYEQDFECSDLPVEENKRSADENNNSRFQSMAKRFKASEPCSAEIDTLLAENVTDLFRNGIDEMRYSELIKDELNGRPSNCEGLVVTQTNPLIWDAISPAARSLDKKLQNVELSVIKSATMLTKVVDKMAKLEADLKCDEFGRLIDECNDSLALMGQANKQINLTRKDNLRPELKREYTHLCNHNRPYTKYLFGDDVSKSAREIEDCSKMSNRMIQGRPYNRGFGMRRRPRFPRFRGGYGYSSRGRGYQANTSYDEGPSYSGTMAKNFPRRGGRPYRQ